MKTVHIKISAYRQCLFYWINFNLDNCDYVSFSHNKRDLLNKFSGIKEYFNKTYGRRLKAMKWLSKHKG